MRVRFWGTRGSIPVAMTSAEVKRKLVTALVAAAGRGLDTPGKARAFVEWELDFSVSHTFGGNSSCVQIDTGGPDYVLCDLGSGARVLGNNVLATGGPSGHRFHVFMSHLHWDHIMGFPFFMPAYLPGNHVRIYGCHDALEEAFRRQNAAPSFPVDFSRPRDVTQARREKAAQGRVLLFLGPAAEELFDRPRTRFVAEFIGRTNLIDGVAEGTRVVARGRLRLRGHAARRGHTGDSGGRAREKIPAGFRHGDPPRLQS